MVNMLASLNCTDEVHLLIGISGLSYSRACSSLANDAHPIVITNGYDVDVPANLKILENEGRLQIVKRPFNIEHDLVNLGRAEVGKIVDRVFVTLSENYSELKRKIFKKCQVYRIPINTTESSDLSTFTLLSSYTDGHFQMGITTSGKGCKLANRIKRELVAHIPKDIGLICERVGQLRERIQEEDRIKLLSYYKADYESIIQQELGEHEEDAIQSSRFNNFISEFNMTEAQKRLQRSRWLSQIVEYYPFNALASISINDLSSEYQKATQEQPKEDGKPKSANEQELNNSSESSSDNANPILVKASTLDSSRPNKKGSISLVGAGPGSLSLLTLGALHEINTADLVLADKLVPQQVIDLIPSKIETFIARKFPGNAEAAQEELLSLGLRALNEGKKVVRLKQGDPYIFGRGGEEYIFFESNGFKPLVLPGITSALSSPVGSNIPATQRDVADQVLICTGTGRRGVLPDLPDFVRSRTTVFLMSLHRIGDLIPALINRGWDPEVPAAIVERSSCPDQRVTRTKLKYLVEAVEEIGSRPPGLLVVGYACEVLVKAESDQKWIVEEGYESADGNISQLLQAISQ